MTVSLRERTESDLLKSLEGEYGLPVELISPDGEIINISANTGEPLTGQILYDTVGINPETGEEMIVNNPIVTLRRSSLSRVPAPGATWAVKIPISPSTTADLETFIVDSEHSPEGGRSIGFIKLHLIKAQQSLC